MAAPIISKPDHSTGEELRVELEALNQALQFRSHTRCKSHSPLPRHSPSPAKHPKPSFKVPFMRSASFISCDRSKGPASPRSIKAHHHQNQEKKPGPPHSPHQEKNGSTNRDRKGHHQQQHRERRSLWHWKPLRAISHLIMSSHCRLHVVFTLHVQRIEGLPVPMNGLRLSVRWICKHQGFQTMPSRVFHGIAEFGQTLRHQCTVFGTRGHNDMIRYDAKPSTLSIVALDVDEMELAKHHVDLSTFLAQTDMLGSIRQEDSHNTSYELSGMGKGSTLIVSFSYEIAHQDTAKGDDGTSPTTKKCNKTSNATKNLQPLKQGLPSIDVSELSTFPPLSEPDADAARCNGGEQPGLAKGHALQEFPAENSVIEASNLSDSGFSSSFEFKPNVGSSLEHEHQDEFCFLHSEGEGPTSPKNFESSLNEEEGLSMSFPFDNNLHIHDNSNLREEQVCRIGTQVQSDQGKLRAACDSGQEASTIGQRTCKESDFMKFSQTEFDDEVDRIAEEFLSMLGVN